MRRLLALLSLVISLCLPAAAGRAAAPVDLALVLAIDASISVDAQEFDIQVEGLAQAFERPGVLDAIAAGPNRTIAVLVMLWSGENAQVTAVPWRLVDGEGSGRALAGQIRVTLRTIPATATSISGAMRFGLRQLAACPCTPRRRVIDISGDGRNNQGPSLIEMRARADAQGVTINGLAIRNEVPTLHLYYQRRVIVGPAAFVEVANDYAAYGEAIERKLRQEIIGPAYAFAVP